MESPPLQGEGWVGMGFAQGPKNLQKLAKKLFDICYKGILRSMIGASCTPLRSFSASASHFQIWLLAM
jgi:hypothetical protein